MPGRGRSPVQQAWDYAIDAPGVALGARFELPRNPALRLRTRARGLRSLRSAAARRAGGARTALAHPVGRSPARRRDRRSCCARPTAPTRTSPTSSTRNTESCASRLIGFLSDSADGPKLAALGAIEPAQKILDRILFIAFAQRTDLLPDRLAGRRAQGPEQIPSAADLEEFPRPCSARSIGATSDWRSGPITAACSPQTRSPTRSFCPTTSAKDVATLGHWDYRREVPVTVLGHIFEQSITDIEKLKAEGKGEAPPAVSKRKRAGVVYTPDMVTRFLVERTVGLHARRTPRRALGRAWHGDGEAGAGAEDCVLAAPISAALRDFTIVDPACGSGAFLVAAFDGWRRIPPSRRGSSALGDLGARSTSTFSTRSSPRICSASTSTPNRSRSRGCRCG